MSIYITSATLKVIQAYIIRGEGIQEDQLSILKCVLLLPFVPPELSNKSSPSVIENEAAHNHHSGTMGSELVGKKELKPLKENGKNPINVMPPRVTTLKRGNLMMLMVIQENHNMMFGCCSS